MSLYQEIDGGRIDKASAYILFFEREGLNPEEYLPQVDSTSIKIELGDLDDELEMDFKKQCAVMQRAHQFESIYNYLSRMLRFIDVFKLRNIFTENIHD